MSVTKMSVKESDMFFARENELKEIKALLEKGGKAMLLYGKRRVGKTELILQSFRGRKAIYFECLRDSVKENVRQFVNGCRKAGVDIPPYFNMESFQDVFSYLNSLGEHLCIAIDEYSYLYQMNNHDSVDSSFQSIIDQDLSNLSLILSGSEMGKMKDLLQQGNPLYGRFALTTHLPELNYQEVSQFYPNLSVNEKAAMYALFGGSPFVNKEIDPSLPLRENVIKTFLKEGSEVYSYANNVLISDIANEIQARRVLSALANSKKRHNDLVNVLDQGKTGVINRALSSLLEAGIVAKRFPINKADDAKKARYEIVDNPLRFFYAYIYPNKSALTVLGPSAFYDEYIAPTILHYISYRFEELVRQYFSIQIQKGHLFGIRNIGSYYYDDPVNKTNGEFDVALESKDGYCIYEAKYLKNKMKVEEILQEVSQIEKIPDLAISQIGFCSINGFEKTSIDYDLIAGEQLYS